MKWTLSGFVRSSIWFCFNPDQSATVWEEAVHCGVSGITQPTLKNVLIPFGNRFNSGCCVDIFGWAVYETDPGDHCHGLHFQVYILANNFKTLIEICFAGTFKQSWSESPARKKKCEIECTNVFQMCRGILPCGNKTKIWRFWLVFFWTSIVN